MEWLGHFGQALYQKARAGGYRAALFGMNAGTPEPEDWNRPGMAALVRLAGQNPDTLAISLHEGKWGDMAAPITDYPFIIGRFRNLLDSAANQGTAPPTILLTEWAWKYNDCPDVVVLSRDAKALADLISEYPSVKGAFFWNLAGGTQWAGLPDKLQRFIAPLTELALAYKPPAPPTPPPPPPDARPRAVRHRTNLIPQNTTLDELRALSGHLHGQRQTFTYSHDVVDAIHRHAKPGGQIVAWEPERWDIDLREYYAYWQDQELVIRRFSELSPPPPAVSFRWEVWPTVEPALVTQAFGENPDYYGQFGLPGHEGLDLRAPLGTDVRVVTGGTVFAVHTDPDTHNYGIHVRVRHERLDGTFQTVYAHLQTALVTVGQAVTAGQIIGKADNTGNIIGGTSHLHLMMKREQGGTPGWPANIIDPTPWAKALRPGAFPAPPPAGIDLLPYLKGDGRIYMIQASWGPQEKLRTVDMGAGWFRQQKNREWEELFLTNDGFIARGVDTSPGNNRYYRLRDEPTQNWSRWIPRTMAVGQVYQRNPWIYWHSLDDCRQLQPAVRSASVIDFVKHHERFSFTLTNRSLTDVVELAWRFTPGGPWIERYLYAKGYGLVGWLSNDGRRSEYADPATGPEAMRVIACL